MSLLLALTATGSPDVTSTLAFTTDDITFAGAATVTISGTLAFTTDDVAFAGSATVTITSALAFTTDGVTFAGIIETVSTVDPEPELTGGHGWQYFHRNAKKKPVQVEEYTAIPDVIEFEAEPEFTRPAKRLAEGENQLSGTIYKFVPNFKPIKRKAASQIVKNDWLESLIAEQNAIPADDELAIAMLMI